jgi:hypothetical protein
MLMQVPGQSRGSLGAVARLVSGTSTNDLLLRWDSAAQKRKTFVGRNELAEQVVGIDAYLRGRYFFLPDVKLDPDTLQVFMEDPQGAYLSSEPAGTRRYRPATYDDAVLDSNLGLVSLRVPARGRVLVHYHKNGNEVGSAAIGRNGLPGQTGGVRDPSKSIDFDWNVQDYLFSGQMMSDRSVDLIGAGVGTCLLLWEPGDNSPFEIDNSYAFASAPPDDVSSISYRFRARDAAASPPGDVTFRSDKPGKRFIVLLNEDLRATFANFYPFNDPDGLLYGPRRDSISGTLDFDIVVQFLTPVSDLVLEENVVPGSVLLAVNGVAETRFEVDPASGRLTMGTDVLPTDRIDVAYRTTTQGTSGGDILFAWQDRIPLSDAATLGFSAGARWNANPWTFSQEPYAKSGTLIATAGIDGKTANLSYSAQAGVAYTNPDTTGILRLFGMEGSAVRIDLSEDNAYPASAPADPSVLPFPGLTRVNRGFLYYRDYRVYDALGSAALQPIEAPAPSQTLYADGERMGPYAVLGSNGSLSAADLVMEYRLAAGEWVGSQVPVSLGTDTDLSTARAVTIRLRGIDLAGSVVISLQIGSVSEDLDGSGSLEAEASPVAPGFPFVDAAHAGVTLKVGAGPKLAGNGRQDSEDTNANGILDLEDPARIVTKSVPVPGIGWTSTAIPLSDSDRQRLLQARSIRLIVQNSAGIQAEGRIIIDAISLEGTPFWPASSAADRPSITVREVAESLLMPPNDLDPAQRLEAKYPDTYRRFHPAGERNEVLEVLWGVGTPATSAFSVKGFVASGSGGIGYQTVVAYLRSPTPGVTCVLSLLDASGPAGRGAKWTVTFPDAAWHEVKVSRKDGTVRIDGAPLGDPPQFDAAFGSLSYLNIDLPPGTGALYVDEVYCTDPADSFGAALVGSFSVQFPGVLLQAGTVPLVSNVDFSEGLSLRSAGFSTLYGIPSQSEDLSSSTRASADLLFARVSVDVTLREAAGSFASAGGHRIRIPAAGGPVTLLDAFSLTGSGGFARENALTFSGIRGLSLTLDARANADTAGSAGNGLLSQAWQAGLTLAPFAPLTVSSSLSLSQAVTGYQLVQEWYGARWAREAALVVPWEGAGTVQRVGRLSLKAGIPAAPVGIGIEAEAAAAGSDYTGSGYSQANDLSLGLSLLAKLEGEGGSGTDLSITYRRILSITTTPARGPMFAAEIAELGRVLSFQGPVLIAAPFVELLADNASAVFPAAQSAVEGSYLPSITVSLQRGFGSRLIDLLVPTSLELSFGQDLEKTADLSRTKISLKPKTVSRAVNLFGQLGAYPVLPSVRTDEYSVSVAAAVEGSPGGNAVLSTLSVEAYAALTGDRENTLTFIEALRRDQAAATSVWNDLQALLDWTVRPAGGVALPLLPPDIGKTGSFEHRESAKITVGWQDSGSYHPFTLVLGHATSVVYEGHGTLKASVGLGIDVEYLGSTGIAWRFAVNAAVEAKLTF